MGISWETCGMVVQGAGSPSGRAQTLWVPAGDTGRISAANTMQTRGGAEQWLGPCSRGNWEPGSGLCLQGAAVTADTWAHAWAHCPL